MSVGRELRKCLGLTVLILGLGSAGCTSEPPAAPAPTAPAEAPVGPASKTKAKPAAPGASGYEDKPGGAARGK